MCGRYALGASKEDLIARFNLAPATSVAESGPRYNLAPGQVHPVVVQNGAPHLAAMRWGLVPAWSKEPSTRYATINARVETLAEKPAYRGPLRRQRCLVPATGFYEWQVRPDAAGKAARQAYHMQVLDGDRPGALFAFAGLYDIWHGPDGAELATYTIVTTAANPLLRPIHERMPVILPRAAEARWLDPAVEDPDALLPLLQPYPADAMVAYPVSAAVNSPAQDGPALIAPVAAV
ncbi:MAG TPA: SOS response-associated peptidase [Chloroflexia bacterium]|nr:SOS response-associated peptidase [Chloroflexia bacterium]